MGERKREIDRGVRGRLLPVGAASRSSRRPALNQREREGPCRSAMKAQSDKAITLSPTRPAPPHAAQLNSRSHHPPPVVDQPPSPPAAADGHRPSDCTVCASPCSRVDAAYWCAAPPAPRRRPRPRRTAARSMPSASSRQLPPSSA